VPQKKRRDEILNHHEELHFYNPKGDTQKRTRNEPMMNCFYDVKLTGASIRYFFLTKFSQLDGAQSCEREKFVIQIPKMTVKLLSNFLLERFHALNHAREHLFGNSK
jgi:hypothetical protein